jgi:hypothetical protein
MHGATIKVKKKYSDCLTSASEQSLCKRDCLPTVAATRLHASVNLTSSFFCSIESDKSVKRLSRFTPIWTTSVTCLAELSATNEKHVASTNTIFSRRRIPYRKNSSRHLQKAYEKNVHLKCNQMTEGDCGQGQGINAKGESLQILRRHVREFHRTHCG